MPSRLKVLFLTHRLPYAPNRGDRTRAYHLMRLLAANSDLTVVSLVHDAGEAAEVETVKAVASRVAIAQVPRLTNHIRAARALFSTQPLTTALLDSPALRPAIRRLVAEEPPDVVLAFCSSMARFALEPSLSCFPLVIDMVDTDSAKWQDLSASRKWPMNWLYRREARTLAVLEAQAAMKAFATVAVNSKEVELLKRLAPTARIEVLGIGVDLDRFEPTGPPAASARVVFVGVMNYEPNEAGAVWLAKSVWPHVRRAYPHAELRIVGASPTRRVEALRDESQAISVTGTLPDVRPELWGAAVAVAPLHTARGVQNKVLEAVAAGVPCVVTPAVHEGLPENVLSACTVAETAEGFGQAIVRLLQQTPDERRALATVDLSTLSWEHRLEPLLPLLREAAQS